MTPFHRPLSKLRQPIAGRRTKKPSSNSEDQVSLLRNGEDEEEVNTVSTTEDLSHIQMDRDEFSNKATELESRCANLQASLAQMKIQQVAMRESHITQENQREKEDKEIVSTMRMMKDYIESLESKTSSLTKICREQASELEQLRSASTSSESSDDEIHASKSAGISWDKVAAMAKKLSDVKKENKLLKKALVLQSEKLRSVAEENERLQSRVDEIEDDREILMIKCGSLEEAALTLAKETEENLNQQASTVETATEAAQDSKMEKTQETNHQTEESPALPTTIELVAPKSTQDNHRDDDPSEAEADSVEVQPKMPQRQRREVIVVETVQEDSDDESDSTYKGEVVELSNFDVGKEDKEEESVQSRNGTQASNSCFDGEEHAIKETTSEGTSSTEEEEEEARDELGPLPSNPFNSLREDEGSRSSNHTSPSCSLTEMQKYLEQLAASGTSQNPFAAQFPTHQEDDKYLSTSDARLEILENMGKNSGWRNKIFGRVKRQEKTDQVAEAMLEGDISKDSDDGVWC